MKILFLPNWKVFHLDVDSDKYQAPNKYVKGGTYWFFKYFPPNTQVDIIDICKDGSFLSPLAKVWAYFVQAIKAIMVERRYDLIISHANQNGIILSFLRLLTFRPKGKHLIIDVGAMNGGKDNCLSTK